MIEKDTVLYNKKSGEKVIFDEERDGMIYAHVRDFKGNDYESKYLLDIIKFGGWNPVVDFKKLGINNEDDDDVLDSMPD
jgi:hypothetical protein